MVKTAKEAVAERIQIVDQPEEIMESRGINFKLIIPVVLVFTIGAFMLVRRVLSSKGN